jgi:UDP-N-acetylmuramoylalanine--D-glutamate ligase
MVHALPSFEGLDHRCKRVFSDDGLVWINDSKATNVGATLAAIDGLATTTHQLILIAGGDGKGADFSPLKSALSAHVQQLICFGKDGNKICALKENSHQVANLDEAIKTARTLANAGDLILLSPACASIDMFDNYMQRGEQFIEQVRAGV